MTKDQIYVIEKVARMRALQGRYGVDHSEILNFEFEQANRERFERMNNLVYKNPGDSPTQSIFERLTEKEMRHSQHYEQYTQDPKGQVLTFHEWSRRKDAERRIKNKLIREAKNDIRQELFELA